MSKFKKLFQAIFLCCFLFIWVTGLLSGLTASACKNDRYEGVKKLRYCNVSIAAGAWMDLSRTERSKGSIVHLERGIALAQLDQEQDAINAFKRALIDSKAATQSRTDRLKKRIVEEPNPKVHVLWEQILRIEDIVEK